MLEIKLKLDTLPSQITQGVAEMKVMNEDIKDKMAKTFTNFNNQLRIDSERLQEIESKLKPVPDIVKKIMMLDSEMASIRICDMDVYHMKRFLHQELPLLVHYQLCEGLDTVSGQFLP